MQDATPDQTCQSDALDPARATALATTLGRDTVFEPGDALPPFFHQIYFWTVQPADELGRDGHPRVGGLIPDLGLPRRMWAGGRLTFHRPLRAGIPAEKNSHCPSAARKVGRSGPLGLVTLHHDIFQSGVLCVTEQQDLVYRSEPDPNATTPVPPVALEGEDQSTQVFFTPTQLFRYSALTFNGHRIHYDLPYAQQVEGYAGLVVHGPLLAQFLMLLAEVQLGPLSSFSFRSTSPLMDFEAATLCCKGTELWVRAPDGRQCLMAEAVPRSE